MAWPFSSIFALLLPHIMLTSFLKSLAKTNEEHDRIDTKTKICEQPMSCFGNFNDELDLIFFFVYEIYERHGEDRQ